MTREKKPRPDDLLTARDIANETGMSIGSARNLFRNIARRRGGPVYWEGVRRYYVYRSDLDAAQVNGRGSSS